MLQSKWFYFFFLFLIHQNSSRGRGRRCRSWAEARATAEKNSLAILLNLRIEVQLQREAKEMRRCNFVNAALATSLHTESWALKSELAALKEAAVKAAVKAAADDTATANKQMTVHFAFMRLREYMVRSCRCLLYVCH